MWSLLWVFILYVWCVIMSCTNEFSCLLCASHLRINTRCVYVDITALSPNFDCNPCMHLTGIFFFMFCLYDIFQDNYVHALSLMLFFFLNLYLTCLTVPQLVLLWGTLLQYALQIVHLPCPPISNGTFDENLNDWHKAWTWVLYRDTALSYVLLHIHFGNIYTDILGW